MLEIKSIVKTYELKDTKVDALKGVTMRFRRSEFVSILGPSGCGKTTLLNVIGGLDRYNGGDLVIDGVSTKNYKDKDWDNYRNHRVGFVFQSYNLIPHQTVLENVELALTLSGTKKSDRRARAVEVLKRVGLGDKLKSKPSQLSGGQMQRVAIARALVNNPEIILADEPTGALDSKTSVQIMDLLKEVSKDRLVIMVTHNPELAEQYSNRIIRLLDGELLEDSKPYSQEECERDTAKCKQEKEKDEQKAREELEQKGKKIKKKKREKTSMSFFTAMFLSLKNLLSKKGRTIMVSIAGSIGIIGIALILAVSSGMTGYINNMQSQSLSSYPVSVLYMALDTNKVIDTMSGGSGESGNSKTDNDKVSVYDPTTQLMDLGKYNYFGTEFVDYVEDYYSNKDKRDLINDYNVVYASDMRLIRYNEKFATDMLPTAAYVPVNSKQSSSALNGSVNSTFFKGLDKDYVLSMYNMLGENAKYPEKANEVALVLNGSKTSIYTLFSLGLGDGNLSATEMKMEDIIGQQYRFLYNYTYYNITTDGTKKVIAPRVNFNNFSFPADMGEPTSAYFSEYQKDGNAVALYNLAGQENMGMDLTITCVLQLKEDAAGSIFSDGIMYTKELSEEYKENCKKSQVVQEIYNIYFAENADGELEFNPTKATQDFPVSYKAEINELNTYFTEYAELFNYTSPVNMDVALKKFNITLPYEKIIDIYLQVFGASDIPLGVQFYAKSFDAKDDIEAMIASYNETAEFKLVYSDSSQLITNMLKNLVNIISYVLIAFAAISLLVSSIMISIITYTSVIERTKEIGVLRSVGASKRDIFWVFTAETVIIGLVSGLVGVGIAGILSVFVSLILKSFTGVGSLAVLQPLPCLILIAISVGLTFLAGLVPSRIATKKDPVLALRSE